MGRFIELMGMVLGPHSKGKEDGLRLWQVDKKDKTLRENYVWTNEGYQKLALHLDSGIVENPYMTALRNCYMG